MPHRLDLRLAGLLGLGACAFLSPAAGAGSDDEGGNITVVSSRVSDDYTHSRASRRHPAAGDLCVRGRRPLDRDRERRHRSTTRKFIEVARTLAAPLARKNFVPSSNPRATKQLIMVYWGRTSTPQRMNTSIGAEMLQQASAADAGARSANSPQQYFADQVVVPPAVAMPCAKYDPATTTDQSTGQIDADNSMSGALSMVAAENRSRDLQDARNASLLGYDTWWDSTAGFKGTPLEHRRQDMIDELEQDRYFVILMAYDFQTMWKQKKHKLLWETRFSIRQRGIDFTKQLPQMVQNASKYFGEDSHGLIRDSLPAGRVDVGDIKTLGVVASK